MNSPEFEKRLSYSLEKKYRKQLWSRFIKGINEYDLIQQGDRIAVCISGGKDSMLMARLFMQLHKYSDFPFDVEYIVMDPGYNPANREKIEENAAKLSVPVKIFESKIFDTVKQIEQNPCYLCARMRRGHLYSYAEQLGCNKIALGHHFDDVIETILMGMLYGAQVQTMMPRIHSTNFTGMQLIRPMYLVREADIIAWANYNELEFIRCACRFTENAAQDEGLSKRAEVKRVIAEMKKVNPNVDINIFRSVENVNLETIISYHSGEEMHSFKERFM